MMATPQPDDSHRERLQYLPRLIRLLLAFDAKASVWLFVLHTLSGLVVTVDVYLLYRLVDAAGDVVAGRVRFSVGLFWVGALILANLIRMAIGTVSRHVQDRFQEALRGHIEEMCYRQSQAIPLAKLEDPSYHDQLQRVLRGTDRRLFSTMSFFWGSFGNITAMISLLIYLGQFHWGLPLILVAGTTPGVFIRERVHRQRYLLDKKQTPDQRRFNTYSRLLTDRHSAAEVRVFSFGPWLIDRTRNLWRHLAQERIKLTGQDSKLTILSDGLNALTFVVAILFGLRLLITGRTGVGAYAAFFYAVENFQGQYWGLVWNASIIYNDLRYVQDFFEFVNIPSVDPERGCRLSEPVRRAISFDDVSFVYPGSTEAALKHVNLEIRPRERIALVGENGSGKSTLVKLLMGLYTPTTGRILVDGIDLQEIAPADWQKRLGVVFQEYNRYEATVRENIAFGSIERAGDEAAVAAAATKSGADQIAAALRQGLDTPLGKTYREGAELSVGQWQKLAIARSYIRPAEILILDEPASALDAKAEAEVYRQFADMTEGRCTILISHRLGSCRMAERIVVMKDGCVEEEGTHQELVSSGGEYADLYSIQAAWYQ